MSEEPENNNASTTEKKPKKRRWRRRLLITAIVLAGLGWMINGPVTRSLASHFFLKTMAAQGATGTVEVAGTLLSGLSLRSADFSGDLGIQKLQFAETSARYSLWELIDQRIARVHLRDLTLILDVAKFPTSDQPKEKEPFDLEELRRTLATVARYYRPLQIDFQTADVQLLQDGQALVRFHLDAFSHESGSDHSDLIGFQVLDFQGLSTPEQDSCLTWTADRISLDQLSALPDVMLENTSLSLVSGGALDARSSLKLFDAHFSFHASTVSRFTLKQDHGELELGVVRNFIETKEPFLGRLTELDLTVENFTGQASLLLHRLRYGDLELEEARLAIEVTQEAATARVLLADAEPILTLDATLPVKDVRSFSDLQDSPLKAKIQVPELERFSKFAQNQLPTGQLKAEVNYPVGRSELSTKVLFQNGRFQDRALPQLSGQIELKEKTIKAELTAADAQDQLDLSGEFDLAQQQYTFSLKGDVPVRSQLAFAQWPDPIKLKLSGSGDLKAGTHSAQGTLNGVAVIQDQKSTLIAEVDLDWPQSLKVPLLSLGHPYGGLNGALSWQNSRLTFSQVEVSDSEGHLLTIDGSVPAPLAGVTVEDLIENEEPFDLAITADEFSLTRLPIIPAGIRGRLNGNLKLGGTFVSPTLDGVFEGRDLVIDQAIGLNPLDFNLTTTTEREVLHLNGRLREGGEGVAIITGQLPVTVTQWFQDEKALSQTPIQLDVKAEALSLNRFREAIPGTDRVSGNLDVNLSVRGTVADPQFLGQAVLNAERIRFENEYVPDLRDSKLRVDFARDQITIAPSSFTGSGGEYTLAGSIDLRGEQPLANIQLKALRALAYRNDSISIRLNADLRLLGALSDATLSGNVAFAESLYYQDLELIPFGVPADTVPEVHLPQVDVPPGAARIPIPDPWGAIKLNLAVSTPDPILIRGNLATGRVVGSGTILGTLANPDITLNASLKDTEAELPLSKLKVVQGAVTLRPDMGWIPEINIRGKSSVGQHQVFVYAYGKASSPTLVFTSNPLLPEAEVLTLLGTGTTTTGLEDQQVASVKAFQLLLSELRRKYGGPGGNKVVGTVLDTLDTVDLRVGDNDPFSGRRFNSATLQLSDKWFASAAFDNEGNSRGIIIYALRF